MNHLLAAAVLAAAAFATAVGVAPTAHADDRGFLDAVHAAGVPTNFPASDGQLLSFGDQACRVIRAGTPPQNAAPTGWGSALWGPQLVDAAQHELCPDTLH
jgi:hypothetical protein